MGNEIIGDYDLYISPVNGQVNIKDLTDYGPHYELTFTPDEALRILDCLQRNKAKITKAANKAIKNTMPVLTLPTIAYCVKMAVGDDIYYHATPYCEPLFHNKTVVNMTQNNLPELETRRCFYCGGYILEGEN